MSHYAEKHSLEDYMDRTFGQFDTPEFAKALPVVLDKGIIFLSTALTTQLMRLQGIRDVHEIELYFSNKTDWVADLEFTTKKETNSHVRIPLFAPFNDKFIKNASYCDDDNIFNELTRRQGIRLDSIPQLDLNSILFGNGAPRNVEVFSVYIIKDVDHLASGGLRLTFTKLGE